MKQGDCGGKVSVAVRSVGDMFSTLTEAIGPVLDRFPASPIDGLDEADVLGALATNKTAKNLTEAHDLVLVAAYCALNDRLDTLDTPNGPRAISGGETLIHPGGPGTPKLREFAAMDLAARMGRAHYPTLMLIADVLDLKYRLPKTWAQVMAGEVQVWRARNIAQATHHLSAEACAIVDVQVYRIIETVGPARLDRIVQAAVIAADPAAAEMEAEVGDDRQVTVDRSSRHGRKDVFIRADAGDVIRFDAAVDFVADLLGLDGDSDSKQVRRAKAIGIIANPNAVLELFARTRAVPPPGIEQTLAAAASCAGSDSSVDGSAADWSLLDPREPTADPGDAVADFDPDGWTSELMAALDVFEAAGWDPVDAELAPVPMVEPIDGAGCRVCGHGVNADAGQSWSWSPSRPGRSSDVADDPGSVSGSDDRSWPTATVFVHISQSTFWWDTDDPCRIEYPGQASVPVTAGQAFDLLGHCRVTVQPVIDLNDISPVDGYEVRGRLRQAVFLKSAGTCPFPYCDTFSIHAQCDHTICWPRGPTELGNLSPPDTRHHRVKTHGQWQVRQPFAGLYVWKDPHGQHYLVDQHGTRAIPARQPPVRDAAPLQSGR